MSELKEQCAICGKRYSKEAMEKLSIGTLICKSCNVKIKDTDSLSTELISADKSDLMLCFTSAKYKEEEGLEDIPMIYHLRDALAAAQKNHTKFCFQSWLSLVQDQMEEMLNDPSSWSSHPISLGVYMWIKYHLHDYDMELCQICKLQGPQLKDFEMKLLDYLNKFLNRIDPNAAGVESFLNMFFIFRIVYEGAIGDMLTKGNILKVKNMNIKFPFRSLKGLRGYLTVFENIYAAWSILIRLHDEEFQMISKYFDLNHHFWYIVDDTKKSSSETLFALWNKYKEITEYSGDIFAKITSNHPMDFHWYNPRDDKNVALNVINPDDIVVSGNFLEMILFGVNHYVS